MSDQRAPLLDDALRARLERLCIAAKKRYTGSKHAERRSLEVGEGIEFADHRPYMRGDDVRRIDWQVYARTGGLLVRLFEAERDAPIDLLVDTSGSMGLGAPTKLDRARRIAAAIAYIGLARYDAVAIHSFGDTLRASTARAHGRSALPVLLSFLEQLTAVGRTDLGAAAAALARKARRRSLVVLITDAFDPDGIARANTELARRGHEPMLVELVDSSELSEVSGDWQLVDAETGAERLVRLDGRALVRARERLRAHEHAVAFACRSRGVAHARIDRATPTDRAILDMLRRARIVD